MVEQAAFLGSASLETSGFSVNRARMWQAELGGGGALGGCWGPGLGWGLSLLQPVPSFLQEQINISLDHRCRIFQNLDGALGEQ